jgi:hypothetical protein
LLDGSTRLEASPDTKVDRGMDAATEVDGREEACDSGTAGALCVVVSPPTYLNGALTVDDQNVYWVASGQSQSFIFKSSRDGGVTTTLAAGDPTALVSDGSYLYWGDYTNVNEPNTGRIARISVNGGGAVTTLATTRAPECIAIDADNVYWTENENPSGVGRVAKAGGAPATLLADSTDPYTQYSIVVDATNVYWTSGGILSVSKDGGSSVTILSPSAGLASGTCRSLAVVGASLLTNGGEAVADSALMPDVVSRLSLIPGAKPTVIIDSSGSPNGIVASSTDVFWIGFDNVITINKTPVQGGATTTLATPLTNRLHDIALASDGTVYWTTDDQVQSIVP